MVKKKNEIKKDKNSTQEISEIAKIKVFVRSSKKIIGKIKSGGPENCGVGLFYYDTSLIKRGTYLKEGDKIGYIKSLGLDHEIYSTVSGTILHVLVDNGCPVEYGKIILLIDPEDKKAYLNKEENLENKFRTNKEIVEKDQENIFNLTSPIAGNFYRRPSPESKPYVEVGDIVKSDEPVCIVEAMKLMNEISLADRGYTALKGQILEILVENKAQVTAHQVLMKVKPIY